MLPHHTYLEEYFSTKTKPELIAMLSNIYQLSHGRTAWQLFGDHVYEYHAKCLDADDLFKKVGDFHKRSLAGDYYASFAMNSKNFMNIPEKTDSWFYEISLMLDLSCMLEQKGHSQCARHCLEMLIELLDKLGDDQIVFADELGEWMVTSRFEYRAIYNSLKSSF